MKKLEELNAEEAKQAIKDWNTMSLKDFAKKYHVEMVMRTQTIMDELKEKVK